MLVLSKESKDVTVRALTPGPSPIWAAEWDRWTKLLADYPARPKGLELFTDTRSGVKLSSFQEIQEADVIHFHWIDGLVDYAHVADLFRNKPIVWTLHDMNAFTGGCHYALNCNGYEAQCGKCPQLGSLEENDLSRTIWLSKRHVYTGMKLYPVTPSRWLADRVRQSTLLSRFGARVIPNGIPTDIFRPYNQDEIRQIFKVPPHTKIILFGAGHDAERKGYPYLLETMRQLRYSEGNLLLMTFGLIPTEHQSTIPYPIINAGHIQDEHQLAMIYSLADVFVIPSIEDNLPNTVLESLACGTPVAGFRTGGIPDMVDDRLIGALAKSRDVQELISAILWCLMHPKPQELRHACRERAVKDYSLEVQARAFQGFYTEILKS